ncbi:MAG: MECDP-synthase, partial [Gammaproteobacteria bacterium]
MFKKTLISLAVASSVGLTGCLSGGDEGANANPDYKIEDTTIDKTVPRPIYDPNPIAAEPQFPINSDLILALGASQSANYDFTGLSSGTTPADDAVNRLAGFSTSGAFTLKFDGSLNPASVAANAT